MQLKDLDRTYYHNSWQHRFCCMSPVVQENKEFVVFRTIFSDPALFSDFFSGNKQKERDMTLELLMEHSATTVRKVKTKANATETLVREGASAPRGIFRSRNRRRLPVFSFSFVSLTSLASAVSILFQILFLTKKGR